MKLAVLPLLFLSVMSLAQTKSYDIPFDFNQLTCRTNTDSLIGQEIYFFPRNQMYQGTRPEKDTILYGFIAKRKVSVMPAIPPSFKEFIKMREWTILNLFSSKIMALSRGDTMTTVYKPVLMQNDINNQFLIFSSYSAFEDKLFKIIACHDSDLHDGTCAIKFTLQDPQGDTLYWDVNSLAARTYTVTFKGYIKYLRANVLNRKLYIRHDNWVQPFYFNHLDGTISEAIPGEEYTCSDVTIFNIRDHVFPQLALILADTAGKTMIVDPGKEVINDRPLTLSAFCTEQENADYLKREKKTHDSLVIARNALEKKVKTTTPAVYQTLVKKYGKEMATHIIRKEVVVGMTKDMCTKIWGTYHTTMNFTVKEDAMEVWGYSLYRWLRFKGDKLIRYNE